MAKATLDDILKEQKKQTKLLKEVRGLLKQSDKMIDVDEIVKNLPEQEEKHGIDRWN